MPGFWKRPVSRMYAYNMDLGEHYYYPISSYLEAERGFRGETPGALTFNERLARKWVYGRRYAATEMRDRYARSSSIGPLTYDSAWSVSAPLAASARAARARSEARSVAGGIGRATTPFDDPNNVSAFANYKNALLDTSMQLRQESAASTLAREQSRLQSLRAQEASRRSAMESSSMTSSMMRSRSVEPVNVSASVANNSVVQSARATSRSQVVAESR